MTRWECIVCGYVYDEAKGAPEDGIAPGTRWEDVPEDWLCPDCGVGKEDFVCLDIPLQEDVSHREHQGVTTPILPVVIIGTGLAGYGLAREFRKQDADCPMILITSDDGRAYSKPMLSNGFAKQLGANALAQADAGTMAMQLNAKVWTHTRVTAIDTRRQEIHIGDATTLAYGKLVLAVGAELIRPPLAGDGLDRVYAVNDLLDYADFRSALDNCSAKKIAVIGAGLIGSEFANDLVSGGYAIDALDALQWCLPTLMPEQAGRTLQRGLEALGVRYHFGVRATAVNRSPDGRGVALLLDNGTAIEADMVLSAVGVKPHIALAAQAGLRVNRGVVVDRLLRTSAANVYALGDCAEVEGQVLYYVAPLMAGAKALARTLAGTDTEVSYPAMPVTVKTPACPVVVAPAPAGANGNWTIETIGDHSVVAQYLDEAGNLLGFALTGEGTHRKPELQRRLPPLLPASPMLRDVESDATAVPERSAGQGHFRPGNASPTADITAFN
ncbi:MAG: rubredoxin reductase [Variovorax sp.]|nr:MAG: rubredoxin reductase [Variovorax sp.]